MNSIPADKLKIVLARLKEIQGLQEELRGLPADGVEAFELKEKIDEISSLLQENPDFQTTLSQHLQELSRRDVINAILKTQGGRNYLEIGVSGGDAFAAVKAPLRFGIDPASPSEKVEALLDDPAIRYFQMTSDQFFERETPCLTSIRWDVIFIDGEHTYEQSYRDVINSLDYLAQGGVIVMHDCNPPTEGTAVPAKSSDEAWRVADTKGIPHTNAWCGDVWKTIVRLRSQFRDLKVFTLDCDFGLGIISRGKPENNLSFGLQDISKFTFQDFSANRAQFLNLKSQNYLYGFLEEIKLKQSRKTVLV